MNIIDYIKTHKDQDFKEYKFTEIDNLILSLLPYIDFTNTVEGFKGKKITLKDAAKKIDNKIKYRGLFITNTYKMLKQMAQTKRYGNIILYNYMRIVNNEMQFGALTIKLSDNSKFIAFAGTDTSIVGWEEDFKMAYMYPGKSQKYASIYTKKAINLFDKTIRIGGHSKGGNLAISASMNSRFYIKRKIKEIYNNDGPGFLKEQVNSKEYKNIKDKIIMFVPKDSIIGMLLYHTENYIVIKSKGFNILQHDPFNWKCDNTKFIRATLNKRSQKLEEKLTQKLEQLPINDRISLVNDVFNIFKNLNIKDTKDIKVKEIINLIKGFKKLDKETQNLLIEFLLILFIK